MQEYRIPWIPAAFPSQAACLCPQPPDSLPGGSLSRKLSSWLGRRDHATFVYRHPLRVKHWLVSFIYAAFGDPSQKPILARLSRKLKFRKFICLKVTTKGLGFAPTSWFGACLVVQLVKNPPSMRETWVRSLGWKETLEKEMATHSHFSGLKNSMGRVAWQATQSMRTQRVETWLSAFHFTSLHDFKFHTVSTPTRHRLGESDQFQLGRVKKLVGGRGQESTERGKLKKKRKHKTLFGDWVGLQKKSPRKEKTMR